MTWKKVIKYTLGFLILATIIMAIMANRDLNKIYGGHTKKVDYKQFNPYEGPTAVTNVNVLSPDGVSFISGQTVYIEDGVISSIDTLAMSDLEMKTIDGTGKYLIPGLTDAHVHLFKSPNDLLLYVANGVTQIRELIGSESILKWRTQIEEGRIAPDMYIASPRVGSFGTIEGWFMSWSQMFLNVTNAEEAKSLVQNLHRQGYDAIKVYSHLNMESYQAINEEASSLGMDVVGHIPWSTGFSDIWESEQSDIAHLEEVMNAMRREFGKDITDITDEFLRYVEKRSNEISSDLIRNDISITTTLWLTQSFVRQKFELDQVLKDVALEYENPGISEWSEYTPRGLGWLPAVNRYSLPEGLTEDDIAGHKVFWNTYGEACRVILKTLAKNGVTIMAGTDANLPPTVPGFSLHDEFTSMRDAGMSSSDILLSTTSIPADRLGNNTGRIESGRKANLVLLDKNPLEDIRHTTAINTVILNGKVLDRALLDRILAAVREANDASRKVDISEYL